MIKLALFLTLVLLPATSSGQESANGLRCDTSPYSGKEYSPSDIMEIDELKNKLEQTLSENNFVTVCLHQQYESTGHGVLGLVDWDEQKIAEIEINKFVNGETPFFVAMGKGVTVQKAPLGKWHAKDGIPISIWRASGVATDLNEVLLDAKSNLLDSGRDVIASILASDK